MSGDMPDFRVTDEMVSLDADDPHLLVPARTKIGVVENHKGDYLSTVTLEGTTLGQWEEANDPSQWTSTVTIVSSATAMMRLAASILSVAYHPSNSPEQVAGLLGNFMLNFALLTQELVAMRDDGEVPDD